MCGEHGFFSKISAILAGSSPRVRGTRLRDRPPHPRPGIIPACAGNTGFYRVHTKDVGDHPRVCGEHPGTMVLTWYLRGSSPRVRGTLAEVEVVHDPLGIIPACAGNTRRGMWSGRRCWDHPRVCGEHEREFAVVRFDTGSSPRVRGTRRGRISHHARTGIIPACAGNTRLRSAGRRPGWDHPRVCGEHSCVT